MDDQDDGNFAEATENSDDGQKPADKNRVITWVGSEFIANHKSGNWFFAFFTVLILAVAGLFIITKDYIATVSVAFAGVLFAILANHKPRQLSYKIDNKGIGIGSKFYAFEQFKYFTLSQEGAIEYVNLAPLRRFMPEVSIYFPPEEAEKVLALLSDHLPHNENSEKQIDKLAKKLKF